MADFLRESVSCCSKNHCSLSAGHSSVLNITIWLVAQYSWTQGYDAEGCLFRLCRKNGKHLGVAFRNIVNVPLFPTLGLHR